MVVGLRLASWLDGLDGTINGAGFKTYVERILAPNLRPGDLVVMDNLSSHKVAGVRLQACRLWFCLVLKCSSLN